jgi:hypothetical protein
MLMIDYGLEFHGDDMTRQYYILNLDPRCTEVFEFIRHHNLTVEVHLNRTRFWVPNDTSVLTEFLLRFSECVHQVDDSLDLATGLPRAQWC